MKAPKMKKQWAYAVEGRGWFPDDMLRYDCARAATPEDQRLIDARGADCGMRRVQLVGDVSPMLGRWASFGWTVVGPVVRGKSAV